MIESIPLAAQTFFIDSTNSLRDALFSYALFYPLVMAWIWIIGGIWYYIRWENRPGLGPDSPPLMQEHLGASILVPCFNEEQGLRETLHYALASEYPIFEVIAINDGSSDRTAQMLDEIAKTEPRLRVIHLATNQGKAMALRAGAIAANNEFLLCIDGDALLHPNALTWMMSHFASGSRVGAVTGNPRIINRSTLLGHLQVGEFSSIIGLMKRAQRVYGRVFTVSGVIVGYRRSALHRVGYWSEEMITEDIDITWRLQMDFWDVRYEHNALCYIYMPETFKGLWKQRLRWAQGGVEVLLKHGRAIMTWRQRLFWPVAIEYLASVAWAYVMFMIFLLYLLGLFVLLPPGWHINTLLPQLNSVMLGITALVQFGVSMYIDRRYEPKHRFLRNYLWIIWYPLAFWVIILATTIVAVPKTLLKGQSQQRARWESPDRGIRDESQSKENS